MKLDKFFFDQVLTILKEETGATAHLMAASPVGGGSINQSFHLQTTKGSYFLKTKENAPPAFFEKEARGLLLLSRAGAQVPHVMASSDTFLLLEWIPKGSWTPSRMKELGRQLALVHQKQHKMFGLEEDNYIGLLPQPNHPSDNWLTFYREQRLGQQFAFALERGKIHPASKRAKQMEHLLNRLDEWLPSNPPASLLHGDLWSGNILPATDGRNLFIDPAVYIGHREVDLAFSEYFGGFSNDFYQGYEEVYPLDAGYQERKPLYQLYYILVHLNLFGEAYGAELDLVLNRYVGY